MAIKVCGGQRNDCVAVHQQGLNGVPVCRIGLVAQAGQADQLAAYPAAQERQGLTIHAEGDKRAVHARARRAAQLQLGAVPLQEKPQLAATWQSWCGLWQRIVEAAERKEGAPLVIELLAPCRSATGHFTEQHDLQHHQHSENCEAQRAIQRELQHSVFRPDGLPRVARCIAEPDGAAYGAFRKHVARRVAAIDACSNRPDGAGRAPRSAPSGYRASDGLAG